MLGICQFKAIEAAISTPEALITTKLATLRSPLPSAFGGARR